MKLKNPAMMDIARSAYEYIRSRDRHGAPAWGRLSQDDRNGFALFAERIVEVHASRPVMESKS